MKKRKLIGNSLAILINRLSQSVASFILVAYIARVLGPYHLGQYTLAFSYYFLFMTFASQGLKTLFTRELSCYPEKISNYLISGTLLQFIFSLIGYIALAIVILIMPYSSDTSAICYILGLMIIPFSLSNVTEAIFQSQEKMYLITISTTPIYFLRVAVIVWSMNLKHDLNLVCEIMAISELLILLIQWGLIIPFVQPKWQIKLDFIWDNFKLARTFLAIEGMAILKGRLLIIIISLLASEVVVGLYGAVAQLAQPFEIVAHSLVVSVFPSMSKAVVLGKEKQRHLAETVIEILLCVALPLIIGIFFIGDRLLVFLYGNSRFAEGALALNLVMLGLAVASFTRPLGYLLVANGYERVNLIEVSSTSLITLFLGVPLVFYYHLLGAAITSLIITIVASGQYVYGVYTRLFSLNLGKMMIRPLLLSVFMLIIFSLLKLITHNILVMMIIATSAYSIFVGILALYSLGGVQATLSKFLQKK